MIGRIIALSEFILKTVDKCHSSSKSCKRVGKFGWDRQYKNAFKLTSKLYLFNI